MYTGIYLCGSGSTKIQNMDPNWVRIHNTAIRAVDLDPHSFSLLDPNPNLGGKIFQMKNNKMQGNCNNCKFIQFLKVNLYKLHCFLLLSNLLWFLTKENSS